MPCFPCLAFLYKVTLHSNFEQLWLMSHKLMSQYRKHTHFCQWIFHQPWLCNCSVNWTNPAGLSLGCQRASPWHSSGEKTPHPEQLPTLQVFYNQINSKHNKTVVCTCLRGCKCHQQDRLDIWDSTCNLQSFTLMNFLCSYISWHK